MPTGMRASLILACALLAALALACSSGTDDPAELAEMAFEALKRNDLAPFDKAIPTASQLEDVLEIFRERKSDEEYQEALREIEKQGGLDKMAEEMRESVRKSLEKTRARLSRAPTPIDWERAEFGGLDTEKTKTRMDDGMEVGDFSFFIVVGVERYSIEIRDCLKTDDGWLTGEGFRYRSQAGAPPVQESPLPVERVPEDR